MYIYIYIYICVCVCVCVCAYIYQYYTSIPLAKWLYNKHITSIKTIQTNLKGFPKEKKEIKGREKK